MTALGKLFRTTAFKLTLVYLTVFAVVRGAFCSAISRSNTRRLITEQITETVDAEISGLSEQYRLGGIRRLVVVVDAARPPSRLQPLSRHRRYTGEALAGNVDRAAARHARQAGLARDRLPAARRAGDSDRPSTRRWCASSSLPGGFRLLVGRDLEERERLYRHRAVGRPLVGRSS